MNVEKKMDMSLDDIIKANRGGNERRKTGDAKPANGNKPPASKKAAAARNKGANGAARGQGGQARNQMLAPRQTTMKKQAARRAPIHVTPDAAGRVPRAMSITIKNHQAATAAASTGRRGGRRSPPPGFVTARSPIFVNSRSMQPPPGLSRGGRGGGGRNPSQVALPKSKPATLNERFSQFSQSGTPAVAIAMKNVSAAKGKKRNNSAGNNRRRRNNKGSNRNQPAAMEL